ncbi:hypothetical protein GIB67_029068 [Kingdonia uniflora]|uniref:FAF domain-containing protein n=1 Tax=Kingdonia uniflora TaxID=39325 RepID=A0A7J7N6E6_9MAGN|nr:hypothetical protein GIB67_029068 [Kingdonia uniflora]
MSTTLCQELQLSLDPRQSMPMTLTCDSKYIFGENDQNRTSWEAKDGKESSYIHPVVKRSLATLSEKSLEMCTETLGCETGTNIISGYSSSSDGYSMSDSETMSPTRERPNFGQISKGKKLNIHSFPPPLPSASRTNGVQIRPHREGGRLVIKAVKVAVPPSQSYLEAERSDGRLKLRFVEDYESLDFKFEEENTTIRQQEAEVSHGKVNEKEDGKLSNYEGEMEIREIQRFGGCKEGRPRADEMLNWGSFWTYIVVPEKTPYCFHGNGWMILRFAPLWLLPFSMVTVILGDSSITSIPETGVSRSLCTTFRLGDPWWFMLSRDVFCHYDGLPELPPWMRLNMGNFGAGTTAVSLFVVDKTSYINFQVNPS